MKIQLLYCKNCGNKYRRQFSGEGDTTAPQYGDDKYCPSCKKLIVDVLKAVNKYSEVKWVKTTELTFEECDFKYHEYRCSCKDEMIPFRCFPVLYNLARKEHEIIRHFETGINKIKRQFIYSYWPSEGPKFNLTTVARINCETGEIIGYR